VIWLLAVLAVAVIAVFIWNYRRQTAAREAASAERMKAFLEQARASTAAHPAANPSAPAAAATATTAAATAAAAPARAAQPLPLISGFTARVPLLSEEQRALYALLKSGLPDHEVFARVSLAAFVQPVETITGFAREAQERRLADAVADFLVCDKSLKAVAAVLCGPRSGKAAETAAFAAACVESVGVRWVELSPPALPQAAEIKQRVLGLS
jgi:hypothetical protein